MVAISHDSRRDWTLTAMPSPFPDQAIRRLQAVAHNHSQAVLQVLALWLSSSAKDGDRDDE